MEAAYSSCNSLNYLEEQIWCCKSFDCETSKVYDKKNDVLSTLTKCEADSIDVSHSHLTGLEPSAEFSGVTGKGVLLWLPPGLESTKGNIDVPPPDPKHTSIGKNVFLNICSSGQDETRLALDNGRGQVEKKCLVNLIGTSRLDEEDNSCELTFEDGSVTVVDLSVISGLISKIQSQEEVDYFCQKIIEHFRDTFPLPSLFHLESTSEHPTKHNYFVVYNVLSRDEGNCNANSTLSCKYLSESPKKSPKTRKAGKKSKRESTVFGNEKKSKFTFDALIGSQTTILGYKNFNYKVLKPSVTEAKKNGKFLTAVTNSVGENRSVIIEVDLSGIEVPSGLKVDVSSSFLTVKCASEVFNTHMKFELPICHKFPEVKNVPYHCDNGIMFFNIKLQNLDPESTNKKLLNHSASVDSGIGCDEFCGTTLSSILPQMIELDELADEATPSWPKIDMTNGSTGLAALTEHQLANKFAAESSSRKLVEKKSGQNTNQKCICDKITTKNLPVCDGTLLPTYEVSQTKSAIYLNVMCGVGIEIQSLQVCAISPYLISISYKNAGACSTSLRYCIHVSLVDIEQKTSPSEKWEKYHSFKYESEDETNSLLKGVHLLESTLVLGIEKTTAGFWEAIWAGQCGNFRKLIIKKEDEQTKQHLQLIQVPEPRRLADPSSTDASPGALGTSGADTATTRVLNGSQGEDTTNDDEKSIASRTEKSPSDVLPKARDHGGRKPDKGSKLQQGPRPTESCQGGGASECGVSEIEVGKTLNSSPASNVNVNAKKKFGEVLLAASKNGNDKLRTKQADFAASASSAQTNDSSKPNVNGTSSSNNKKKNNKAVKNYASPVDDKENHSCFGGDDEEDEVFESRGVQGTETEGCCTYFPALKGGVPRCLSSDWPAHDGKRLRRSSESIGAATRKASGGGSKDRSSPPLPGSVNRPRGILKRRGRSLSESHIGSLEECLGEELLGKYGSVERALVGEYGCLEGLMEECGWDEEDEDGATKGGDEAGSSGGKKSVRFSDVEKCHLFMSKASIVNQLANDDKKAMRMKMKEQKKKTRLEKRQAQKSGHSFSSGSNNSSYRDNNGYNSFDEDVTTEESDGAELISTSSGGDTTDNTEDETEAPARSTVAELNRALLIERNSKGGKKRGGSKKNNKKKRVELTNNMIFQLDMEA